MALAPPEGAHRRAAQAGRGRGHPAPVLRRIRLARGPARPRRSRGATGSRPQGVRERRALRKPVHDRRDRRGAPDGPTVLQFGVPMNAEGVSMVETWDTLGMRGTGSHDVVLDGVFVPDAAIGARRKPGVWHPLLHLVAMVAFPLVYSVYAGIAEAARDIAVEALAKRRASAVIAALGALDTELAAARMALDRWWPSPDRAALPGDHQHGVHPPHAGLPRRDPDGRSRAGGGRRRRLFPPAGPRAAVPRRAGRPLPSAAAGPSASSRAAWRSVCRSTGDRTRRISRVPAKRAPRLLRSGTLLRASATPRRGSPLTQEAI